MPLYVNNTEITDEQVFAEMQYHPASSLPEAQEKAAQALAIRELLLQEAARLEITAPDASASAAQPSTGTSVASREAAGYDGDATVSGAPAPPMERKSAGLGTAYGEQRFSSVRSVRFRR